MDIDQLEAKLGIQGLSDEDKLALVSQIQQNIAKKKAEQTTSNLAEHTKLVIRAIKKIEEDLISKFEALNGKISTKVASLKDGAPGRDGRDGQDGSPGRDGVGSPGPAGNPGMDGRDGVDGTSVTNARIDFDGSLIINLSDGREINAGEVVPLDLRERIKYIGSGGGTSQYVLDTLESLQTQINALGNGLVYKGTWDASANTPSLQSSVGTGGDYYVVSVAGSTNLNGTYKWQVGDWAIYNGTTNIWQKLDGGSYGTTLAIVNDTSSNTDYNITFTSASSGLVDTEYVDASDLTFNPSTQRLTTTKLTVTNGRGFSFDGAVSPIYYSSGDNRVTMANYNAGGKLVFEVNGGNYTANFNADGTYQFLNLYSNTVSSTPKIVMVDSNGVLGATSTIPGTTDSLTEGTTNLYFTNARARSALSAGTGISYNSTTGQITNSSPDQTVSLTSGTGISTSGTYPNFTIANTAPDQTVSLTGSGTTTISGTYPNFTIASADQYTGTVTGVTGTSPISSSGGTAPAISLASGYGDTQNPYASKTANYVLASPNGVAGVPTFRAIVASDIPTLNQNTTGSAATLSTGRTISISGDLSYTSPSFDGSANVTAAGTLATVNANVGSFTYASITVNGKGLITAASSGTAPVTSVTATSPISSSGGTTPAISLASGYGDTQNPYASKTANYFLSAPNGSAGVPSFRAIVAADIPTLNQNTTGSAGSVATTDFTIVQSGTKLLFKYGATTIASLDSTGVFTTLSNHVANGTP